MKVITISLRILELENLLNEQEFMKINDKYNYLIDIPIYKMTKDELISYISSEKSDSPLNRFNNDFLKLQLNMCKYCYKKHLKVLINFSFIICLYFVYFLKVLSETSIFN
mgnify:CR=1 FL=1